MPLFISDDTLKAAGLTEHEAKVEIACRWFDAAKLSFTHAAALAGLSDLEFETQLQERNIPRLRYTDDMLTNDVESLKKLGRW